MITLSMETLLAILSLLFGGSTVTGFILYNKASRRIKNAEAEKAEADADDAEVKRLHSEIDHMQVIINNLTDLDKRHTQRMSELNATINKNVDRAHELSDRLYQSESELNRRNERIEELLKENANERLQRQYFEMWLCTRTDCKDPRGAKPPRDKLKGMKFDATKSCGGCAVAEPTEESSNDNQPTQS